jgi:hypothetical protein
VGVCLRQAAGDQGPDLGGHGCALCKVMLILLPVAVR